MDLSTLKLVMENGPREIETHEYSSNPGFTISIGRIVRGSTFAIKDNRISSKHLSIKCCSQDKWLIKDLDSSYGTLLNSSPLSPLTEHDLRDDDVLTIGEVTSIRVRISHFTDSQPVGRNIRSRARVLRTGNSEGVQVVPDEGNPRGRGHDRGRGRGDVRSGDERLEIKLPDSNVSVLEKDGGTECKAEPPISSRRTTRSRVKKKDNSTFTSDLERIPEASQLAVSDNRQAQESAPPTEKRNTQETRGKKRKIVETESAQSVMVGEQIPTESMSNRNEMEIALVKPEPQSIVDEIIAKGGHSSKESMSEIAQKDGDLPCQLNFEHKTRDEPEASLDHEDRREPDTGVANPQESTASKDWDEEVEIAPDLNKMTVGEWLDYLEWLLPKQIRAETDQIIQYMQKRSQQVQEFVLQQLKDEGKLPLG